MIALSFDLDPAGRPIIDLYLYASPSAPMIEAMNEAGESAPSPVAIKALVDTGASRSMIQRSFLDELDLDQVGTDWVSTASSGSSPLEAPVFAVQLFLAGVVGGTIATDSRLIAMGDFSGLGVGMLLGRDILEGCLLVYNGQEKRFTLAFG